MEASVISGICSFCWKRSCLTRLHHFPLVLPCLVPLSACHMGHITSVLRAPHQHRINVLLHGLTPLRLQRARSAGDISAAHNKKDSMWKRRRRALPAARGTMESEGSDKRQDILTLLHLGPRNTSAGSSAAVTLTAVNPPSPPHSTPPSPHSPPPHSAPRRLRECPSIIFSPPQHRAEKIGIHWHYFEILDIAVFSPARVTSDQVSSTQESLTFLPVRTEMPCRRGLLPLHGKGGWGRSVWS